MSNLIIPDYSDRYLIVLVWIFGVRVSLQSCGLSAISAGYEERKVELLHHTFDR